MVALLLNFHLIVEVPDLQMGANTITFSFAATGVVACTAEIFERKETDRVVVSDIDGTITKDRIYCHRFDTPLTVYALGLTCWITCSTSSDETGHIWVSPNSTRDVARNGYKMI